MQYSRIDEKFNIVVPGLRNNLYAKIDLEMYMSYISIMKIRFWYFLLELKCSCKTAVHIKLHGGNILGGSPQHYTKIQLT